MIKEGEKISTEVMIMSLGGSPDPLAKSIMTHRPDQIFFFASQDSVLKACDVLEKVDYKPKCIFEITENPNLMFECYKTAKKCVDRVRRLGVPDECVVVDYTGGTKVMTAALILATIGQHFRFNYVGGDVRTKDGLGVVVDGYEKMFAEMNPWSVFAEEERRQVVTLFNRRRFSAVMQIIDECMKRELPLEISGYFSFVRPLAEGFLAWEQFNHVEANKQIGTGIAKLRAYVKVFPSVELEGFAGAVQRCKDFLEGVIANTKGFQVMHISVVDDLLNNARRRVADKRYDDAAARIYRALEMYGQIVFAQVAGCPNDKVVEDKIPAELREEFTRKYMDPSSGHLKLPLEATFRYLRAKGHEVGVRFFDMQQEIRKIQHARNYSILAHGIQPVTEQAIESIYRTVTDFVRFENIVDFPLLP